MQRDGLQESDVDIRSNYDQMPQQITRSVALSGEPAGEIEKKECLTE
uniref:Uncharacterized protein n=1 Tax=Caenorhabditis japonica TaxID=281687 RepID=A0A8R1IXQ0_CAEJA